MAFPEPRWLLDCEPREVQLEALRRSIYGYSTMETRFQRPQPKKLQHYGNPAVGWSNFIEMRLGKTPISLNEFLILQDDFGFKKLVVFAPNSYKEAWVSEVDKFGLTAPAWAFETSEIKAAQKFVKIAKDESILVVNYEALQFQEVKAFLSGHIDSRTLVVADESIKIKNPTSLFFLGAMEVTKEAGMTRNLTGLPITQGPQDLWAQLRFTKKLNGLNFYTFRNRYCRMGGFKGKKIIGVKEDKKEHLAAALSQVSFIAKKKDWGKVTDPKFFTADLPMTKEQQAYYDEMNREFVVFLEDGQEVTADQVITKMIKLAQISSGFIYTEDGNTVEFMDPKKTPKMKRLLEFLDTEVPSKTVIPYVYKQSGKALRESLAKFNPAIIGSQGDMKDLDANYESEKMRFNRDPNCRVCLVQMVSGKYGHDLSGVDGDRSDYMIFYENSYSLDDRTQIEARNQIAEQTWNNTYVDFACSKQERDVVKALQNKMNVAEAVLGSYGVDRSRLAFE